MLPYVHVASEILHLTQLESFVQHQAVCSRAPPTDLAGANGSVRQIYVGGCKTETFYVIWYFRFSSEFSGGNPKLRKVTLLLHRFRNLRYLYISITRPQADH